MEVRFMLRVAEERWGMTGWEKKAVCLYLDVKAAEQLAAVSWESALLGWPSTVMEGRQGGRDTAKVGWGGGWRLLEKFWWNSVTREYIYLEMVKWSSAFRLQMTCRGSCLSPNTGTRHGQIDESIVKSCGDMWWTENRLLMNWELETIVTALVALLGCNKPGSD